MINKKERREYWILQFCWEGNDIIDENDIRCYSIRKMKNYPSITKETISDEVYEIHNNKNFKN